jgi:hypothetical protein
MTRLIAAGFAALLAFDLAAGAAPTIQPGAVLPVRFFCVAPEPVLDMLALDAEGRVPAAHARFEAARAAGLCHALDGVAPATAVAFLAGAVTATAGPVEVWRVRIEGVDGEAYAGFRVEAIGDPA